MWLIPTVLLLLTQAAPQRPAYFTTPLSLAEMSNKQAVVETSKGTFIFELLPQAAPNHVGFFIQNARSGAYEGTTFHRVIKYGIIQGGDPLSKDPAKTRRVWHRGNEPAAPRVERGVTHDWHRQRRTRTGPARQRRTPVFLCAPTPSSHLTGNIRFSAASWRGLMWCRPSPRSKPTRRGWRRSA
jgi:hypothetical protein